MNVRWRDQFRAVLFSITFISAAQACDPAVDSECEQRIADQISRAAALITERRFEESADILEGVLMRQPDHSLAQELYTQALIGMSLSNEEQIRAEAEKMLAVKEQWRTDANLQIRGGYGNNLNQAPTQSTLQLTLPAQPIVLELQPEFLRQAGFGFESQLSGGATRVFANSWQWQLRGDLYQRETEYRGFADYQGVNLFSALTQSWQDGTESGGALAVNGLRYGGDVYLYTVQMLLRHAGAKVGHCKPQAGVDLLWQRQHELPLLDSRYTGLMAGVVCDTEWGNYNATLSAGWDWAEENRPGGDQQRTQLHVSGLWPTNALGESSFVQARGNFLYSFDMRPYSPLLSSGAERRIMRIGMGLDYDWALSFIGKNWRGVASVSWQNQDSNISLFETEAFEGWLGVRIQW